MLLVDFNKTGELTVSCFVVLNEKKLICSDTGTNCVNDWKKKKLSHNSGETLIVITSSRF